MQSGDRFSSGAAAARKEPREHRLAGHRLDAQHLRHRRVVRQKREPRRLVGPAENPADEAQHPVSQIVGVVAGRRVVQHRAQLLPQTRLGDELCPATSPSCVVWRFSVKPIRIDITTSLVPKSSRTVWFAVVSTVSSHVMFTPSTTPNGALFGDHRFNCMSSTESP